MQIFPHNYTGTLFGDLSQFEKNVFSLAYFVLRIQHTINVTCEMGVN